MVLRAGIWNWVWDMELGVGTGDWDLELGAGIWNWGLGFWTGISNWGLELVLGARIWGWGASMWNRGWDLELGAGTETLIWKIWPWYENRNTNRIVMVYDCVQPVKCLWLKIVDVLISYVPRTNLNVFLNSQDIQMNRMNEKWTGTITSASRATIITKVLRAPLLPTVLCTSYCLLELGLDRMVPLDLLIVPLGSIVCINVGPIELHDRFQWSQ